METATYVVFRPHAFMGHQSRPPEYIGPFVSVDEAEAHVSVWGLGLGRIEMLDNVPPLDQTISPLHHAQYQKERL